MDDEIYDLALKKFADLGAHICNEKETKILERTVIDPATGCMQPRAVGQKATDIARMVGISVKPNTKMLIAPIHGVGPRTSAVGRKTVSGSRGLPGEVGR